MALVGANGAGTAWLAVALLDRTPDFAPWLRMAIPVAAAVAIVAGVALRLRAPRALLAVAAVAGVFALAAGPASYSIASLSRSLDGNNVVARRAARPRAPSPAAPGAARPAPA